MMPRQSGLVTPLSALVSSHGWGIGEFPDLATFANWAADAGQSLVQILPIGEMPPGERSPYSAMTAMALDPIYISLPALADFAGLGGERAMDEGDAAAIDALRSEARVGYAQIRQLKERWLRRSWERFQQHEVARGSPRAVRFHEFATREAWWLDEYALFRALHAQHDERPWPTWPEPLARAEPAALDLARGDLQSAIGYRMYLQWVADEQWAEAKRLARPVRIYGDLPFMISSDSPDVWARQDEFRFDATVGVPPDAFSETGQDWGLPPWRAEVMAATDFAWMRARAKRSASLYDGFRIDHLVGLYRTYLRPLDPSLPAFFEPADEPTQVQLGEMLLGMFVSSGAEIIAEDLGLIPAFVRASMTGLGLPGLKVLRWERHWDQPGHPPIDPTEFPPLSVATTGTHDIEPLAATDEGRTEEQREAVLRQLLAAGSDLVLIPIQDVFGWPDRINTPAVVDEINWTWRLPWPIDTWRDRADTTGRAGTLRAWTAELRVKS